VCTKVKSYLQYLYSSFSRSDTGVFVFFVLRFVNIFVFFCYLLYLSFFDLLPLPSKLTQTSGSTIASNPVSPSTCSMSF